MPAYEDPRQPDRIPDLVPLEVPVPPDAARTFGYRGEARFVAFYWEPSGDEVMFDDGRSSGTSATYAFLAYRRHPAVVAHLDEYNLGYTDLEADYCLILDQESGRASIATRADARTFLADQHPPLPKLSPYEQEEVQKLLEEAFQNRVRELTINPEIIRTRMLEEQRRIRQILDYLDRFTTDPNV